MTFYYIPLFLLLVNRRAAVIIFLLFIILFSIEKSGGMGRCETCGPEYTGHAVLENNVSSLLIGLIHSHLKFDEE